MGRTRFFLGEVADKIVSLNYPYYDSDLLKTIPDNLLDTEFGDKSPSEFVFGLVKKLDKIRFQKQKKLSKESSLNKARLKKLLNRERNSLPPNQEKKVKEIRFLFNVAASLLHH